MSEPRVIGIDLGGTNCRGALVSADGTLGKTRRMATGIEEGLEPFLQRLVQLCQDLMAEAAAGGDRVGAIGVGTPGVIAPDGSVHTSPNLAPLNGFPFRCELERRLGFPVVVVNDANAIALGEGRFGAGRSLGSFLAVTLGTGVGGGLVLDRRLWVGADGAAGEIGHLTVEAEGRPCGCGNRGCLEQYASASGIVLSYRQLVEQDDERSRARPGLGGGNCAEVAEAARRGEAAALAAFAEAGRRLGQVLGGVANLLNLEGAVLCGGVSESLDLMRPALDDELAHRAFALPGSRLRIVRGKLGDEAGIAGAAALAFDRIGLGGFAAMDMSFRQEV